MPWLHPSAPAAPGLATRPATFGPSEQMPDPATPFGVLSFELKRFVRPDTKITSDIEGRIVNRCVLAALEVLTQGGAGVDLAGTAVKPVVEARFEGPESPRQAVRAALDIIEAIRRVQRARENEFQVVAALAVGTQSMAPNGAKIVHGPTDGALHRLRDQATPGEVLMSAESRAMCDGLVETEPAGSGRPDAFVLRGLAE